MNRGTQKAIAAPTPTTSAATSVAATAVASTKAIETTISKISTLLSTRKTPTGYVYGLYR